MNARVGCLLYGETKQHPVDVFYPLDVTFVPNMNSRCYNVFYNSAQH